ncbi:MAG: hypothetical protein AAF740_11040 [Bacteroidota bacterium]
MQRPAPISFIYHNNYFHGTMTFKERFKQLIFLMIAVGGGAISMSLLFEAGFLEFLAGMIPTSAGGFLFYRSRQKALKRISRDKELRVLQFLDESEGRFPLGKLALKMRLSVEETEEIMSYLVSKGAVEVQNDTQGTVVYTLQQRTTHHILEY